MNLKSISCLLILFYSTFLFANSNHTNNFSIHKVKNGVYKLQGNFDRFTYSKLKKLVNKYQNKDLELIPYSNGRNASRIFEIQDLINKHNNVKISFNKDSFCKSACAKMAIAAKEVSGKLHFHKISVKNKWSKYSLNTSNEELYYNIEARNRLVMFGIDKNTANKIMNTPSHKFVVLDINKG